MVKILARWVKHQEKAYRFDYCTPPFPHRTAVNLTDPGSSRDQPYLDLPHSHGWDFICAALGAALRATLYTALPLSRWPLGWPSSSGSFLSTWRFREQSPSPQEPEASIPVPDTINTGAFYCSMRSLKSSQELSQQQHTAYSDMLVLLKLLFP